MKKIGIVTSTRAEYGLLKPVIQKVQLDDELELLLWVTGTHLSKHWGLTCEEIEQDGFHIIDKVNIGLDEKFPLNPANAMSKTLVRFAEQFRFHHPDLIILLGDRYEIMAVACAATIMRIPLVHLDGGETTEGAFDEAFRHCITKMSQLHFTTTEKYRRRVIQLGEQPQMVYCVGSLGVEAIKSLELLCKKQLETDLHFHIDSMTLLITFHPVTLEQRTAEEQTRELLNAISDLQNCRVIFTKANADPEGDKINKLIEAYVKENQERMILFDSLGQIRYLSAMQYVGAVVGNSSSGIVEAPSFGIPTVDIGDRQKGRERAETVIHCAPKRSEIIQAIQDALTKGRVLCKNPYESEINPSEVIVSKVKEYLSKPSTLKKKFYDLDIAEKD